MTRSMIYSCLVSAVILSAGAAAGADAQQPKPAEPASSQTAAQPVTFSGPRELLRAYGVDDSQFNRLIDGREVNDDETETLLGVMFRLGDFGPQNVRRWARDDLDLAELTGQPGAGRGEIFSLTGRATGMAVLRPLPEVGQRFRLPQYYRCPMVLDDGHQPAVVFAKSVPKAWQQRGPQDARAGALGVFLKLAGDDPRHPMPVFVAERVAWYPPTLLGRLGMDVGLLDTPKDRQRLTARDREPFYQMMAAVGRAKPGQLRREAERLLKNAPQKLKRTDADEFSVVPLFNQAHKQRGRLVVLSGTARRVVRIRVEPEIGNRFGIDHYYEMAVFTADSQDNPLVFCLRELPEGMPTGEGPRYGEQVRVAGFFFKSWAYHVRHPAGESQSDGGRGHVAPLLIGRKPVWYPARSPFGSTTAGAIAGGLFVLALLGIWLALWRYSRADRQFHEFTIAKTFSPDSGISLNEIGLSADGSPDFSRLEEMDHGTAEKESKKEE